MADEEGLPFDQQANDAIRVCRVGSLMRIVGDKEFSEEQIQEMMERKNRYYQNSSGKSDQNTCRAEPVSYWTNCENWN